MINRGGIITSRAFEQVYTERRSATTVLADVPATVAPGAATIVKGRYVTLGVGKSDATAAPGRRVSLTVRVTPGPKIHVYAPGQQGYLPVGLRIDSNAAFRTHPLVYPPSRVFEFVPLKEKVQVYDKPFGLRQDITLSLSADVRQRATAGETLTITGAFDYQACDDKICYRPETLPLEWKLKLTPIVR